MKKIILTVCSLSFVVLAGFSDKEAEILAKRAEKIRQELNLDKPPLSKEEQKIRAIRRELGIEYDNSPKNIELSVSVKSSAKSTLISGGEKKSLLKNSIDSLLDTARETLLFSKKPDEKSSFYKSIGLKDGEYFGLPSFFGINEKKENNTFGLDIFTDTKDIGSNIYKGFKYSGESAELMSGIMYYNAKMYNTMFGLFDDSPFNIFKDEDKNSIFDIFEKSSSVLEFFD